MTTLDTTVTVLTSPSRPLLPFRLSLTDRRFLLGALVALAVIRFALMWWMPFTDTTEARYAEIARKMLETGDWITPQFDYGVPFWGKPPLHTWLSALGMQLFGVNGFGARILIFLSGLTVVALSGAFMKRYVGSHQAMVVMVVVFSSVLFFGASAFVMTDMVMVLGTTLSMVAFYTCVTDRSASKVWGYLFFVGLAIGLLAKGPTATVLTLMPIGLWVIIGRRWTLLSALPWVWGTVILVTLTLPWYVAAEVKTPGFLRYFIVGEHFERFTVSGWKGDLYGSGHARTKGLIWIYWLGAFLPWTGFAAWLLLRPKAIAEVVNAGSRGWHSYLLLWAIAPMLLFTPAANILAAYVLPGIPASALLLVSLWATIQGRPRVTPKTIFGLAVGSMTVLFLTTTLLVRFSPETLHLKSQQALVAQATQIDQNIRLTYWGGRSYSAEFYTQGQARVTTDQTVLSALAGNSITDAVAVNTEALAEVAPILGDRFTTIGVFGRYTLLAEAPQNGKN